MIFPNKFRSTVSVIQDAIVTSLIQSAMLSVTDPVCEVVKPVVEGRGGTLMCKMTYEYQARAREFNLPPHINVSLSWAGVSGTTVRTTADPREFVGALETNMTVEDVTSENIHSQTCIISFNFSPGIGRYQYAVNTLSYPCRPIPLSSCKCHKHNAVFALLRRSFNTLQPNVITFRRIKVVHQLPIL